MDTMIYGLVRAAYALFGVSIIATRLPSVIAFYLASVALCIFLSRRMAPCGRPQRLRCSGYSPYFRYS